MPRRAINPKNVKTAPTSCDRTHTKLRYKNSISLKFERKLRLLQRQNNRLILKVKSLMTRKQDLQDNQLKYLKLKEKVLETEEKLLKIGIKTTEYSAFDSDDSDDDEQDTEINNDNKFEALLECKLDIENQIPTDNSMNVIFDYEPSTSME